jgi:anti-anti-sigma regulatory factor
MQFKIDTNAQYSVVRPDSGTIDKTYADDLAAILVGLRQNGSVNFVIDLQDVNDADAEGITDLIALHEDLYSHNQSIVFTMIPKSIMRNFKELEADTLLNVAPKMQEAIDIINMEILERDLWAEE